MISTRFAFSASAGADQGRNEGHQNREIEALGAHRAVAINEYTTTIEGKKIGC